MLLATTNPAKQEKLAWLLEGLGLSLITPGDLPPMPSVPEEGRTHQENAEAKVAAWSRHASGLAIASDGGLVIPVLGERWDALRTGRSAGPNATDRDRLDRLLELMRPYEGQERAAYWVEAVALARCGKVIASWNAKSQPGLLAESYDPAAVKPGFWAFAVWYLPELGKPHSLLTPEEIDRVEDHWGRLRTQVREALRQQTARLFLVAAGLASGHPATGKPNPLPPLRRRRGGGSPQARRG